MTNSEKKKAKADLSRTIAENTKRNREAAARNAEANANAGLGGVVNLDTGCVRQETHKAKLADGTEIPIPMSAAHHRGLIKLFQRKTDAVDWLRQERAEWREQHGKDEKIKRICRGVKANYDRLSNINDVFGEHLPQGRRQSLERALALLGDVLEVADELE